MINVLILAAGYAVRLQPLTTNTPKSLLEIGGRILLDRILDRLIPAKDITGSIYIITNEKFFEKFEDWFKGCRAPFEVTLINDGSTSNETRLGAIKDIEMAVSTGGIEGDLLVIAGDNLFDFELKDFLDFSKKNPGKVVVALQDIRDLKAASRFGVAKVDSRSKIVDFEEKPAAPKSTLISTGIYYFPKEKAALIGDYINSGENTDAPGYYIKWLSSKDEVYGFVFDEGWYDIGDIASFEAANKRYNKEERGGEA